MKIYDFEPRESRFSKNAVETIPRSLLRLATCQLQSHGRVAVRRAFVIVMRIIHTIDGLAPGSGGPSRTVSSLAGHLSGKGGAVFLVALGVPGQEVVSPPCGDVRVGVIARPSGLDRFWIASLRWELDALLCGAEPAVVHDHGIWLPFNHAVAGVCRRLPAVTRVVSPRGMLEPWALGHGAWKKRLAWYSYQARDLACARAFHATSTAEAVSIRRLGLRQPVAVIPNAVSAPTAVPTRQADPGRRRTALFLSRIHPVKGLTNLINAWGLIQPDDWRLLIVGGDELGHRKEIESLIASKGLQQSITVAAQVSDEEKWALYAAADLFVLPSYSENFGVVVAEAMQMGLPVITTRATPWSVITEARCGWYIDTGVAPLHAALTEALRAPMGELVAMGGRGRQLVAENFDWGRIAQQMYDFYRWLITGGDCPQFVQRD